MTPIWLMRMARWVRNPPSPARVRLVLGVIALCLGVAAIEYVWGWPEMLTPQRIRP